jgi:RNA recognition motif-containing protein
MSHAAVVQAMHAQIQQQPHMVTANTTMGSPASSGSSSTSSTPPCSTLFVANLGQFVSEQELKEAFSR